MDKTIHSNGITDAPAVYKTVVDWVNHGFQAYPTATALNFERERLSYNQLNRLTNRIASYLNSKGIGKGHRVGISLERSTEMVACVIGILKSGAAYVPLDSSYPEERLEIMIEDAQLSLLVTHKKFSDRFETDSGQIVFWEQLEVKMDRYDDSSHELNIHGEDVAYVIFTSGSTGRPKGIEMPHRALSNLIEWQLGREYFRKGARVLQYSSISFDVSFQEIVSTLASGGTLFLINDEERRDPRILLKRLDEYKIERLFLPFVALRSLIEVAITTNSIPDNLKEVITAGEQLRVDERVRSFFSKLTGSILENQYGPSETHVVTAHLLDENPSTWPDLPPIGKPLINTSIYLLDEDMNPVEVGETGELYLAGRNLAHGYLGREDLTRKSFIKNPLDISNRELVYKTGDLGFYNKDGDIEFLGRADHQIKIRGYRVEPGEINTVGAKYPGVAQCLTHTVTDLTGRSQLVTYFTAQDSHTIKAEDLRTYLENSLPEYMLPAFVVELETIPYTPSGKVDYKSLPKPEREVSVGDEEVVYNSDTEARLAEIWADLLGFKNIPRSSNFFDLGGDSLNAVTLFMEIEEQFDKYLPLSTLTQAPTIEELAKAIDGNNTFWDVNRFRALQLIQQGGVDKPPLFLVHGGAGNVLVFQELTKGLPKDQAIFAFQWPGWDGFKAASSILEMAEFYKNELREAWPSGPYRLGGHCIGGIIAIEVAKLLRAEGAEVLDPILISDSPNLHSKYFKPGKPVSTAEKKAFEEIKDSLKSKASDEVTGLGNRNNTDTEIKKRSDHTNKQFPVLAKLFPFYSAAGKAYFWILKKKQLMRLWFNEKLSRRIPMRDRGLYCARTQIAAVKRHDKSVYDGDVLYLKSNIPSGHEMSIPGWWDDIHFGFKELCSGHFDAYVVGGKHDDVLKKQQAHKIINEKMLGINE